MSTPAQPPGSSARPRTTARRVGACFLGLALVAAPALSADVTAGAAGTHRMVATATASATASAHRTAVAAMSVTAVASVPGSVAAPVRVTVKASARGSAVSAAKATGTGRAAARATTRAKALSQAKSLARKQAAGTARSRAAARAAAAATTKAKRLAAAKARTDAIAKARAQAISKAEAGMPAGTQASSSIVAVAPADTAPCGGELPAKVGGGRYSTCTFDDDFSGSSLDTSKWSAMDATKVNFKIGDECFNPNNVATSAGTLQLTGTKAATAVQCAGRSTPYRSGLVSTKGLFSQTYGRFEMRAKFPAGTGYGAGFWMLPENPMAGGYQNYKYGEIDIVENWGMYPNLMWAHVHYVQTPGNYMSGKACSVKADGDTYHTYGVDWSPTQMTFIYDGNPCWTTTWKPVYPYAPRGAAAPAPFDQPFYMILNLSLGGTASTAAQPLSRSTLPVAMNVDWVRAWK